MNKKQLHQELCKVISEIDNTLSTTAGHHFVSAARLTDRLWDIRNIVNALLDTEEISNG